MPADDLVLNVRQIAGYPPSTNAPMSASVLMQLAGLGSAYVSISPADLVGTALASGGDMAIGGKLSVAALSGGSLQFSNAAIGKLIAQSACLVDFDATFGTIKGVPIATSADVAASVVSFNMRSGHVMLELQDILCAGGAPTFSPRFRGEPRAPTPAPWSNTTRLATTEFVHQNVATYINQLLLDHPFVFTFNGRSGDVVLTAQDIIDAGGTGEIFNNAVLTGIPTAPTAPPGTDTTQVATTEFVTYAVAHAPYAPLDSPQFTGFPSGPTAPPGSSTGQFATTAFVQDAIAESTAGVASFNGRTGIVTLTGADITGAGGALLVSPVFTGVPTAPTAAPGTSNGQLATTAFVEAAVGGVGVSSFNTRTGAVTLTTGDITGAGGAPIASPALTGIPTAPTAAPATNTTQIATTAFVTGALASGSVTSFNTRTGAITLLASDISAAGGATLNSPIFTGTPVAPTAAPGVSTAQIATCAFVAAAVGGSVTAFNGRTGAITLTPADISAAGGAPLASPHFTGTPTAPTPATSDNSTTVATTAFVDAAIAANAGVLTFNGRAGAVTLSSADLSAAGGALIASPTFTGTPAAPTAAANTNTTQLATTAFVMNALSAGGGVQSFNGRAGAVTLTAADVNSAGGPYLPLAGGTMTGPLTPAGFVGVSNASNAAAGQIGEVISSVVASPGVTLASATFGNVTSISLTPGDWDVHAELWVQFGTGGGTTYQGAISMTTAGVPSQPALATSRNVITPAISGAALQIAPLKAARINVAAATTVFLVAAANFASGTTTAYGIIWARRAR